MSIPIGISGAETRDKMLALAASARRPPLTFDWWSLRRDEATLRGEAPPVPRGVWSGG